MKKQYTPSKEMRRKIKQMNSIEMGEFLSNVFQEGFNAALKNTNSITVKDLHDAISSVKGIGEKRMIEIDNVIEKLFEEKSKENG